MNSFDIVTSSTVQALLEEDLRGVIDIVRDAYLSHRAGRTVNPNSYFLKFPRQPADRIIALPAALETDTTRIAGLKWISSFPANIERGKPRASAVLMLNRLEDGLPFACLEASLLSAARTAASAVLAAYHLSGERRDWPSIGFIGGGVIARTILDVFVADGWSFERLLAYDLADDYARTLASYGGQKGLAREARQVEDLATALSADIVVLATTAAKPYIAPPLAFRAGQIVLNVSLRDITPELILASWNIVDDVDHCLKAETSPHLAEQISGSREFVAGTIADLILGEITPDRSKALVFSPFGMGILDLALGISIYERALPRHEVHTIPDFFSSCTRW